MRKNLIFFWLLLLLQPAIAQNNEQINTAFKLRDAKKYKEAIAIFSSVLRQSPENTKALEGRAFSLAWDHQYKLAEKDFIKLNLLVPQNIEFEKGLAYVHLWMGNYKLAEREFKNFIYYGGEKEEYLKAIADSYIQRGQQRKARKAIAALVAKYPKNSYMYYRVQSSPAFIEITPWAGYSKTGDEEQIGFRGAEIVVQPTVDARLWFRYDNSLAQDIQSIIKNQVTSFSFFGGGSLHYKSNRTNYFTTLELGHRHLSDKLFQRSVRAEQVVLFSSAFSLKAGALFAPRNDKSDEYLLYAGIGIPVSKKFQVQPTVFYSVSDFDRQKDTRGMLEFKYHATRGTEVTLGVLAGQSNFVIKNQPTISKDVYSVYLLPNIPIGKRYWLMPLLRYEKAGETELINAALGFKFRIER